MNFSIIQYVVHEFAGGNVTELGALVYQRLARAARFRPALNSRGEAIAGEYSNRFGYRPY